MKLMTFPGIANRSTIVMMVLMLVLTSLALFISDLSAASVATDDESRAARNGAIADGVVTTEGARTDGVSEDAVTSDEITVSLELFASGLNDPVGVTNAGSNDDRLFVLERQGNIRIVQANGSVEATPFMTLTDRVDAAGGEMGLLGLAFDPDYASTGSFYVNYTSSLSGTRQTRISRFQVTADADIADRDSEEILLTLDQPAQNHNAGAISFGPDGYLYIPLGDTGADSANSQDMTTIAGKVSRINVRTNAGMPADCSGVGSGDYRIPPDNPFVDGAGSTCDEIWASGLRNPWQSSFDRLTGDYYIGDVGPNLWEEIDMQPASSEGGENYGWRCYQGTHEYNLTGCGPASDYDFPIFEYNHNPGGCAVVGGTVYRGSQFPDLYGRYFLTDYCTGFVWDLVPDGNDGWLDTRHTTNLSGFAAFGESAAGELFLANRSQGKLYQLQGQGLSNFVNLPLILRS